MGEKRAGREAATGQMEEAGSTPYEEELWEQTMALRLLPGPVNPAHVFYLLARVNDARARSRDACLGLCLRADPLNHWPAVLARRYSPHSRSSW